MRPQASVTPSVAPRSQRARAERGLAAAVAAARAQRVAPRRACRSSAQGVPKPAARAERERASASARRAHRRSSRIRHSCRPEGMAPAGRGEGAQQRQAGFDPVVVGRVLPVAGRRWRRRQGPRLQQRHVQPRAGAAARAMAAAAPISSLTCARASMRPCPPPTAIRGWHRLRRSGLHRNRLLQRAASHSGAADEGPSGFDASGLNQHRASA